MWRTGSCGVLGSRSSCKHRKRIINAGACPGGNGDRRVDCKGNRELKTMLPSRQVVYQHRSPGRLNTSTEAVERTQAKAPIEGNGPDKKGVNTMGDHSVYATRQAPVLERERETINRFWDATLLCFTPIARLDIPDVLRIGDLWRKI